MKPMLALLSVLTVAPLSAQTAPALVAEAVEIYYGPGAREMHRQKKIIAIRADGSRVELRTGTAPDGTPFQNRLIMDLAARKRIAVNGLAQAITTDPMGWHWVDTIRRSVSDANCGLPANSIRSTHLGYTVIQGETPRATVMRAPELGCLEMKAFARWQNSVTTIEITKIREGTLSDAALFTPPAWPELSPSEAHVAIQRRYPSVQMK